MRRERPLCFPLLFFKKLETFTKIIIEDDCRTIVSRDRYNHSMINQLLIFFYRRAHDAPSGRTPFRSVPTWRVIVKQLCPSPTIISRTDDRLIEFHTLMTSSTILTRCPLSLKISREKHDAARTAVRPRSISAINGI